MIGNAQDGKPLPVYGQGTNVRDGCTSPITRGDLAGRARRRRRRDLQHRRQQRGQNIDVVHGLCRILAEETGKPESDLLGLITYVKDRPGHDLRYAIDATRSATSSAGRRARPSRRVYAGPCAGTSSTRPGSSRCARASTAAGSNRTTGSVERRAHDRQRHHLGRRFRHTSASVDKVHQQAADAGLRQADDLLPAVVLMLAGIKKVLVITTPHEQVMFKACSATAASGHGAAIRAPAEPRWPRAGVLMGASSPTVRAARSCSATTSSTATACKARRSGGAPRAGCDGVRLLGKNPEAYGVAEFDGTAGSSRSRRSPSSRAATTR